MKTALASLLLVLGLFAAAAPPVAAQAPATPATDSAPADIAFTFDDLPALTIVGDQAYVNDINRRLLAGLKRHHIPAIGFVNESKLAAPFDRAQQIAVLKSWLDAGMMLGNHSFSHKSPNELSAADYVADIARGEQVIRPLIAAHGQKLGWYRYPYLETGSPAEKKAFIDHWLAEHGYRIAPVTMENSDWMFAEPYDDAVRRGDTAERDRIGEAYVAYTARMFSWYKQASQALFGRQIAFVMLMHATRINADNIDRIAALAAQYRLHPVTLPAAMRDKAYRTADNYTGNQGIEWLERYSMTLKKPLPWGSFTNPPADIQHRYAQVDGDQGKPAPPAAPTPPAHR